MSSMKDKSDNCQNNVASMETKLISYNIFNNTSPTQSQFNIKKHN